MAAGFVTSPNPVLTYFAPSKGENRGSALIIFAGGGYCLRSSHEGEGYAEFFAAKGFHCFVCAYRVGEEQGAGLHPAPLEDGLFAIETVRKRADELGFAANRVGVIGSSAGGHLAAHLSTVSAQWGQDFRPDWTILCYPVIALSGPSAHQGSRQNLLGKEVAEDVAAQFSAHALVSETTPPAFLWHTMEDAAVPLENSILYSEALRKNGVPFELHITEKGRHGLGREADFSWAERAVNWLESSGRG